MKKEELNKILWFSIGTGLAIGAVIFISLYWGRKINNRDPRVKEVQQLIEEAERLISLSKKNQ